MAYTPPNWGGTQTSKDYELMMQGASPIDAPVSLIGHGMTSFGQELTDAVDYNIVTKERGRVRNTSVRIVTPEQTALTFTLLMGGYLWTPLLDRARRQNGCTIQLYAKRLCPPNSQEAHAYIYQDVTINPPSRVNDFIVIDGSTTVAEWQSESRASRELTLWAVGGFQLVDGSNAIYGVGFLESECENCDTTSTGVFTEMIATGGDGSAAMVITVTDNRFQSVTNVSSPASSGAVGRSVAVDGNRVLIGFSDGTGSYTSATTGGTVYSTDRGRSFVLDAASGGITEPIYGTAFFGNLMVAVGGTGAGASIVYVSVDGTTWTLVSSAALAGNHALLSVDVDREDAALYMCGESGVLYKATAIGDSLQITSLTSRLPGSPDDLRVVRVLGRRHLAVAGASGYYAESIDGGTTWTQPNVPGTTLIRAIGGNRYRTIVGAGNTFYIRDLLTDYGFSLKTLEAGVTIADTITSSAVLKTDPQNIFNYILFGTDSGQIILFKPFYPNA